jgi:tetratricopeptide (TPR) repeat protein
LPETTLVKTEPAPIKPQEFTNEKEIEMAAIFISGIDQPSIENKICFLEKYLAKYESNLTAVEYLSFLYLQQGKPKECHSLCSSYLERLSFCPDEKITATLAINCSAALNELGRYSETIKCMEERLRHSENDLMHKNIADAFFSIGVMNKAVYHYERATKLNAKLDEAFYNLAVILYQQDSFFNAKMNIDKALWLNKNSHYLELRSYIEERI